MRAIITVSGKDKIGIISTVSAFLADQGVNVLDISQTIMSEYFVMIMLVGLDQAKNDLATLSKEAHALGEKIGMSIHLQHEDVFNAMHSV